MRLALEKASDSLFNLLCKRRDNDYKRWQNRKGYIMKLKKTFRKLITALLAITMVLTLLPANTEAAKRRNEPKKIVLNKSKLMMVKGESRTLKVKKTIPSKASKTVTWSSSNKKVATVTPKGKVKAKRAGTVKIFAKSKHNSKIKAVCKITIYNKTKKISLLCNSVYQLNAGQSVNLKAKVTSPAKKIQPITWKSNNSSIATVTKSGNVRAVREGAAIMTGTSGGKKVTVKIIVTKEANPIMYYTVTFVSNASDVGKMPPSQKILAGRRVSKPVDPIRNGYVFGGWHTDKALKKVYNFSKAVTGNLTLYAKWVRQTQISSDSDACYQVTFDCNDGSKNVYEIQKVAEGKSVAAPADPERDMYGFTGWYMESAAVTKYDFGSPVKGDMVLYAGWGSPDGSTDSLYSATNKEETIYSISGVEMNGNTLQATINTNSACALVVEFYEDTIGIDGSWEQEAVNACLQKEPITRVATQTPDYGEMICVSIPVETALTDYYLIRARLVELDGEGIEKNLCESFLCIDYSAKYARFEEKTVYDFPEEKVVNFDESTENNFGVFNENVKIINSGNMTNRLVVEDIFIEDEFESNTLDHTYTFYNPDNDLRGLRSGDPVYVTGTAYLFKIKEVINNSDGSITFTTASDVMLTDFYDVLKTDMKSEDSGIQPKIDIIDVETNFSSPTIGGDFSHELIEDTLKVSGTLSGSVQFSIQISYDAKLFAKDYFECNITTLLEGKLGIKGEVSKDNDGNDNNARRADKTEIPLPRVSVPTPVPGLEASINPKIPIEWEASGSISLDYTYSQKSGFQYNSYSGREDIKEKSQTVSLMAEGKAEIKIGPKLSTAIQFCKDVVKVEFSGHSGVKMTAEVEMGSDDVLNHAESKHACDLCVSGEIKWFADLNLKMTFAICDDALKGDIFNIKLFELEGYVNFLPEYPGICFWSLSNSRDSVYRGEKKYGFGPCKNKFYKTTIQVLNDKDETLTGIPVTIKREDGNTAYEKAGNSTYVEYLYDGIYIANANIDGKRVSKSFVTKGNAQTVILSPLSENGELYGHIKDSETGNNIKGVSVKISKDDMGVTAMETDELGNFSCSLPSGTFLIEITKDGYLPFSAYERIEDGEMTYMQEIELISGEGKGGFRGIITNAVTGRPIEDVNLQLRSGWNNTEGEIIKELKTDSDGEFRFGAKKAFGVIFGIPCGNYTITASKEEYLATSFNIIVWPGEDTDNPEQNGTMSPVMADDTYRIVLTWGENPSDLDSHVVGRFSDGEDFHVYYENMWEYDYESDLEVCNLDLDDITGYGPETITLNVNTDAPYYYYVYHYDGSGTLSTSGAQIKVYHGNDPVRTFHVPTGFGQEDYWNVFAIVDGKIISKNTLTFFSDLTYADSRRVSAPDTSKEDRALKN